jgi:hypothetical protein
MATGGNTRLGPLPSRASKLTGKGSLAFRDRSVSDIPHAVLNSTADFLTAPKIPADQGPTVVMESCR